MARNIGNCPEPPKLAGAPGRVRRTYTVHVVTPIFGGGSLPGVNDRLLIRGPSIRGQLRFWWRATRGARFATVGELRTEEGKIWGTTDDPSPVTVRVTGIRRTWQGRWAEYRRRPDGKLGSLPSPVNQSYPKYALFPFNGKANTRTGQIEQEPATVAIGSFLLELEWPADWRYARDVEAAVWAWANFGGLGARTRRGCGSLYCRELAPDPACAGNAAKLHEWYTNRCKQYEISLNEPARPWPTLPDHIYVRVRSQQAETAAEAWSVAVDTLRCFRQGDDLGRNGPAPGANHSGRSRWPEVDSLRRLTRRSDPLHRQSITTPENAFPRAEFGLPIIFHFKNGAPGGPEPGDCTLGPDRDDGRMASPLVLKALAYDEKHAVPLIMRLKTQPLRAAKLLTGINAGGPVPREVQLDERAIRRLDLTRYSKSPLAGRTETGSALEAFIHYAKERQFV